MITPETMTAVADAVVATSTAAPAAAAATSIAPVLEWLVGALLTGLTAAVPLLMRWLLAVGRKEKALAAFEVGMSIKAYATEAIRHADQEAVKREKAGKDLLTSEEMLKFAVRSLTLRLVDTGLKVAAYKLEGVIEAAKNHLDSK